jgi:cytochrome c oxidase subunit 4
MADSHGHEAHAGPDLRLYMMVAAALAGFTASSFVFNRLVDAKTISHEVGFILILGVAIAKAFLVGMFFMHLKYDWGKLYFIIVPIGILGVMMMVVLLPDIVLAWK